MDASSSASSGSAFEIDRESVTDFGEGVDEEEEEEACRL
jgi:hypothetical protein